MDFSYKRNADIYRNHCSRKIEVGAKKLSLEVGILVIFRVGASSQLFFKLSVNDGVNQSGSVSGVSLECQHVAQIQVWW